jgi:exopolysaccharide production protein ExoZ
MTSVRFNVAPIVVRGSRIAAIDELKGLAIVLVLLYHCEGVLGNPNIIHGEIGVDIFLILSGLTLAMNSAEMPLGRFLLRRFLRIYPSYWLALGFYIWMHYHYLGVVRPWETIWQHILGIHAFSRLAYFADFADAFWFISMIVAAYLVFVCIRKRLDDLSLVIAVTGVLTVIATVVYQYYGNTGGLISLAVRIPSFFIGVIAGRLLGSGTVELRFNPLLGLGLASFYYLTFFRGTICAYTIPALGIIFVWLGVRRQLSKLRIGRIFLGAFTLLGLISYEIYLFHQPLIRDYNFYVYHVILKVSAPNHMQLLKGIFAALAVTLLIAVPVHFLTDWAFSFLRRRAGKAKPSGTIVEPPSALGLATGIRLSRTVDSQ